MTEYVNKEYYNSIKGNCAYIDLNGNNIHDVMDRFRAEGIMFSAVYGSYRNTVTVSKADAKRAYAIAAEYKNAAKNNSQRIIGNIEYSKLRDRNFINTDPATAMQAANLLSGTSIKFSGRILENSATITVSGRKNAEMVNRMIDNIRNADIINELTKAGYERLADVNGFVNIRNTATGETVGFRNMDMVREMFGDTNNEFFHPSAYRVDAAAETAQPYYISEVEGSTAEERNVYTDKNGDVPVFESKPQAEEYADNNGITLSDFEEIISENVPVEHQDVSDEPLSVQLSARISAEYDAFISALRDEKADVIISSAYEINVKDNIRTFLENEEADLTDEQIKALLSSDNVLDEVYQEWNKNESAEGYNDVPMVLSERADRIIISLERREKENVPVEHLESEPTENVQTEPPKPAQTAEIPVYTKSLDEAREQGEVEMYRASRRENAACAKMIDAAIEKFYNNNILDSDSALKELFENYSYERIAFVTAVNIAEKDWDRRISDKNKVWADDFLASYSSDVKKYIYEQAILSHPVKVDLFVDAVRTYAEKERKLETYQTAEDMPNQEKLALSDIPVYAKSFEEAREQGEEESYRASRKENAACANMINAFFNKHYNNNSLDSQGVLNDLLEMYPAERIALVVAVNIADKDRDRRISDENRAWANAFLADYSDDVMKHKGEYYITAHPGLVNIFTNSVRDYIEKNRQIEIAKNYIRNYLESEFLSENVSFDDLKHIPAGYTELGEYYEYGFRMEIDLADLKIRYLLDNEIVKTESYNSIEEMNELALSMLDFDDFCAEGTDAVTELENRKNHLVVPELGIDVDMREIDNIEVKTPDNTLIFYYSQNNNDIERAWESDDNSDTAVSIDEVKKDLLNSKAAGFTITVRELGNEKAAQVYPFDTPENTENADLEDNLSERLTAHHDGKFMIEEFYNSNSPSVAELADFIKNLVEKENQGFGLTGYAVSPSGVVLADSPEYSWEQVAQAVKSAIDDGKYISDEERAEKEGAPKYTIYQVKKGEKYRGLSFVSWEDRIRLNIPFDKNNYEAVYGGFVSDISSARSRTAVLEDIYTKFNIDHPEDFRGHSLSMGDVIVIEENNIGSAYYVDAFGMTDVTAYFMETEKQKTDLSKDVEKSDSFSGKENSADVPVEHLENVTEETQEFTPQEKAFLEADLAAFMTKHQLAWDEIEDIGYILFEKGYTEKHSPSERSIYGNGLSEPALYDFARRMHNGEDIRREFTTALLGRQANFFMQDFEKFFASYGENTIALRYGNAEKEISYAELDNALFALIENEYNDIVHDRTVEDLQDVIPNLDSETAEKLISAFDGAALPDWEKGDNQPKLNRIKEALFEILGDEGRTEKAFASIADMKYNVKFDEAVEKGSDIENPTDVPAEHLEEMPETIYVGDKFRSKTTGEVLEIVSLTGALPWYTDDCTVERQSGKFSIAENISYEKLLNSNLYEYIGRTEPEKEQPAPDPAPKKEINISEVKNLSQLKKALQTGMQFEITNHTRPECVGEIRVVTGVNSVGFTSRKIDESGEPSGKDIHMEWNKAKNWSFDGGEFTSKLDNGELLMSFHFVDGKEHNQAITAGDMRQESEFNKPEDKGPVTLRKVGDFYEMYGKNAEIGAEVLGLHIQTKNGEAMVGFPDKVKDEYSQKLWKAGYSVLIERVFEINPPKRENVPVEHLGKKSEYTPKIGDLIDINDELLTISDISGSIITFTEAESLFGNTSRMNISDFLASNFTIVEENEKIPDVPVEHFENAEENENVPGENLEKEQTVPAEKSNENNYVITDENLGTNGPKARFNANVAAVELLKKIESENRTATPDEQEILAKYTGWGAIPQAFDGDNQDWKTEYEKLKTLLTDTEYSDARRSTLNAHYTSPTVISAIYDGLANLGFVSGKILEPAMGIGNFFGAMPEAMRASELHGVELDSVTGRIAKQLYPGAEIQIKGFENTKFENNSFDAVVGNVPFGDYKLDDKDYNKYKFFIHDYFIAKSLDKVRPGGVLAVVTSKGTMDKESSEMRKYIAQRAELLGAIRLPNNAFKANAGTEVTSDILFFQKRERPIEIDPDKIEWLKKSETADGLSVNNYFVQHPEMVLGKIVEGNKMYGTQQGNTSCEPIPGANLKEQLAEAIKNIKGTYTPQSRKAEKKKDAEDIIPAPANSRAFSYYAVDGNIYYRADDENMNRVKLTGDSLKRALAMVEMRDTVRELLDLQLENADHSLDGNIADKRAKLNQEYDDFTAKYGHFDDKKNARLFKGDDGYNFLTALENKEKDSGEYTKADIFYHDTVKPNNVVTHVETAEEALILSIAEKARVDFDYMTELCGRDKETLINDLEGQIYRLPQEQEIYVTADEYLTGNIRFKLHALDFAPEGMDVSKHREALEAAMPKRVEAKDISVKLGSHWVAPKFVTQFINEKFRPGWKSNVAAQYSKVSGKWKIEGQTRNDKQSYTAAHDYGTKRRDAYEILEGILNHEDLTVKDPKLDEYGTPIVDSKGNYVKVTNHEETKAVQRMVRKIESEWQDWIFKDPERRETLVDKYNEVFNSIRHREYDGSHLNFVGMNSDIQLKDHQKNAVARALYGGNTLLAHAVGAGKTFEMITIAMEGKRLGLHNKSLFAVPNSLTEQMGRDFKKLYPAANILVATKKDFEPKNRKEFFAKIATGEWDAVIVGHSQFDRMGISKERMEKYMQAEISDLREQLEEAREKDGSKSFSVKEIEKTIARYKKKIKDAQSKVAKDEYIDFEEMGFDKLFVDECHMYKNLGTATKMSNVAGIGTTGSGKAAELLMKTKYFDDITGGRGMTFASGTPISNSMTELYTMMRYLQANMLISCGINHFDEWAADFGEVKTDYELKPESDGKYQLKTRFAKFTNLPELMGMFKEAADIRTADTLDLEKPIAHVHEVVAQPSKIQKRLIKSLSKRASKIRDGAVDPKDDNMLCVTNDGRKIGLDQRLMQPGCPDEPNSKVNMCVQNVFDIYTKTTPNKSTQVIFCDMSTPKSDSRQDRFEIYRPDKTKDSGFDLIRKKVGLGSGDEDSPKRISSFADVKAYVDKHSPEDEDKLREGDIAVFRIPNEDGKTIESKAAVFRNGQFEEANSADLLENLGMSPTEDMPPKPFNVYDDIRDKLVAMGVPKKEIAFIHDYDTAEKKQALFNQMNSGDVRILLGSTQKCGAGMNAQQKMIALHHLDAPLRPSDMEQRTGRIERQGNENPEVDIFRYVTDKSFDAYLYQILENKQKFISQVMTSKTPERVCSDIDEQSLDYAEVKALCAGNPLIKKEMELQAKIKDLKSEKARYNENLYEIQDNIRVKYPNAIKQNNLIIGHFKADLNKALSSPKIADADGKEAYPMKLGDKEYTTRKEAGEAIKEMLRKNIGMLFEGKEMEIGEYRGLKLSLMYNFFQKIPQACLRGEKAHYCDMNMDTDIGNITRLDNVIGNIQKTIDDLSAENEQKKTELEQMKADVEKPFDKEKELADAEAELEDVHTKLTQFELTDDSAQKDMFERLADNFPEVMTGEKSYIKYEVNNGANMPLHIEMNSDILTVAQTSVCNGDLMYDPRVDFKVDYENKKVIPQNYENSFMGKREDFDISDGKPETMKRINDVLAMVDDLMDEIEEQGFSAVGKDKETEHNKDDISL